MTEKDEQHRDQMSLPVQDGSHPALKLRHLLQGHTDSVYRMALSPDGRRLASPSKDGSIRLWDVGIGQILKTLEHGEDAYCVGWSPDGKILAFGACPSHVVYLWNVETGEKERVYRNFDHIWSIAWSPDGRLLACGSQSGTQVANVEVGRGLRTEKALINRVQPSIGSPTAREFWKMDLSPRNPRIPGLGGRIESIAWSPDGRRLCCGSWDGMIQVWDAVTGNVPRRLAGHRDSVWCVAWSPNGRWIASGSKDRTVRIWDSETGQQTHILEGHTDRVLFVSFLDQGRFLVSLSDKGTSGTTSTIVFWRTDRWAEVARIEGTGLAGSMTNLAYHPALPLIATLGESMTEIKVWDIDFALMRGAASSTPTVYYVNAKAVLLGESGVGKSALGIRIAEKQFRKTDSTHGAQFWQFPVGQMPGLPPDVQAELTLWDLAGQPEYRMIHQLFLDDMDAALLLFDCSDSNDPIRGVPYWAKVLRKHAPPHALKLLVSARCDVSPVTIERREINLALAKYGLDEYFKTSSKQGEGIDALYNRLLAGIPWDTLPRTSTPWLFQILREFLLKCKADGRVLVAMDEVRQEARERFLERAATQPELDTVVQLLQSRGMVYRLDPRPRLTWILLKPELINQYASSIIQAARNHPLGIGCVAERDVLVGNIAFSGFERLHRSDEAIVLEGTVDLVIRHDLCFREMGYLVFPSQMNITRTPPDQAHPRTEVAYRFSGGIEAIYASLVVRLNYTDYFRRENQWKYAVEFSRETSRLGFSMRQVEEGTGELEVYFYPGISEFDRVTFIRFVTDHLRAKGIDIQEQIRLYCPSCSREVTNRDAIEARVQNGFLDIPCQYCATTILIPQSVEERYQRDYSLGEKQQELAKIVHKRTATEVEQFRTDRQLYTRTEDSRIHILHLSDLHIQNEVLAGIYRTQLETDLIQELGIGRLEYLVISGDIANHSLEEEYRAAFAMVDGLVKRMGLDSSRVVVVPGNHDLNWDDSETAYAFVPKRKLPLPLPEGRYIPAGDAGTLVRDEELYRKRFARFSEYFYRRVYTGREYPLEYPDQVLFVERPADHILFLGLNSCWQLDHHFRDRAGIHMPALVQILDRLLDGRYNGWLKIAVWHHPVTGKEMMDDEFVQLLAVHGFQICMHGHIHEAIEAFHKYDDKRGIHIVGAGTFGAPTREQTIGIPLQYNLLTFDPVNAEVIVQSRKKEKPSGAWSADARWGDKNNPSPSYRLAVKYQVRG